ncbi:hypothetical protein [Halorussus sp. GCM10023401]|nr:hypothetical protein [Halorussus vallis]USZ76782.1 hypothetical protein NGM07_05505 [Halorussus vallis]
MLVWKAGQYGNVLRLLPPLVLTEDQAAVGMDVITDAVRDEVAERSAGD